MDEWKSNLIEDDAGMRDILRSAHRVAILGIKPESRASKPAFYVPHYLQEAGYHVIPVPVYYPDVTTILGEPVYRSLVAVPPPIDLVVVFRRSHDIPPHLHDLLAAHPAAVWFQLGIRNDDVAQQLARAGMRVVQDRCSMVEHTRLLT